MNPAEPRTQRDFANQPASARRSRGLQLLLGLFAAGCFAGAWLLGEQGDAQASARLTQTVDVTPGQYLQGWRVRLTQKALRRGRPLKMIATEVGYGSEAALSRAFRAQTGLSPREWKKQLAEANES